MTTLIDTYPMDLLEVIAQAEPPECDCDPDEHDSMLCLCGHRQVDHRPKTKHRACETCPCRSYRRTKHWGELPTAGWSR